MSLTYFRTGGLNRTKVGQNTARFNKIRELLLAHSVTLEEDGQLELDRASTRSWKASSLGKRDFHKSLS